MIYYLIDKHLKSSSAVLRISGPDANTYLQGQFTQDLRVTPGASAYGLWLDQKGKVLADSTVIKLGENEFLVVSFSAPAEAIRKRLEDYLIADEVEIEDATERWGSVLVWSAGEAIPELRIAGSFDWESRRAARGARQWLVSAGNIDDAVRALGERALPADKNEAERARLQAGFPAVPADIGTRDLPNEGGLDEVAISYTKGCYLGQEVMARLKNLGQVRRRLHLVEGPGYAPVPGTALYQGERKLGEIRSSAKDADRFWAMAMLSLVNLDSAAGLALAPSGAADIRIRQRV